MDQTNRSNEARQLYKKALTFRPNEPSVLSNLGMSYLLEGKLSEAENYLRQASTQPGADSRVRQNLALVVGLQGRFDEAREIALIDSTPEMAEANLDYIRNLMSSPRSWDQLRRSEALGG